jgi:hypothetical protein
MHVAELVFECMHQAYKSGINFFDTAERSVLFTSKCYL